MEKIKEQKLTKKEQNLIKETVNDRSDNLEDTVNDHLKSILEDIGLQNNQEALLYARQVFYQG